MGFIRSIFRLFTSQPAPSGELLPPETHRETMLLFGQKLRLARHKHRLTQRQLAELVAARAHDVHEWEFALASPSPRQLLELRQLFGKDLA